MAEYESEHVGQRPNLSSVYLSLIDLTPWQLERMLEVCVWIKVLPYEGHKIYVAEVNKEDEKLWGEVVKVENIQCVREEE